MNLTEVLKLEKKLDNCGLWKLGDIVFNLCGNCVDYYTDTCSFNKQQKCEELKDYALIIAKRKMCKNCLYEFTCEADQVYSKLHSIYRNRNFEDCYIEKEYKNGR